jgi:altronate dehydratase
LEARGGLDTSTVQALATLGGWVVAAGGTVMLSSRGALVADRGFRRAAFGSDGAVSATLAHGQRPTAPGWHVMRMPTTDWMETATGFGAGGAQLVLAHVVGGTLSGQRFVPVVQVTGDADTAARFSGDLDDVVRGDTAHRAESVLRSVLSVASRQRTPRAQAAGNVGFQITRGLLGTSM